ncbi:YceI family protein [Leisingera sp. S132]|uniref:YceI family protein n=1 Tax=Leisingera sp. S132 TaxID=2867016 RepID=UPI0021A2A082|nr:YceI family protein [Leisingera sp. S132]UWQ78677.1 YceI family protein [Leisingera sp. S132]
MTKSRLFSLLTVLAATAGAAAAETYKTDPGHTEVRVGWSHAGVSMQHGEFTTVTGTLELDAENPETASVTAAIAADSFFSGVEALDQHAKSPDFLDAGTYPEITFASTAVKLTGKDTAEITGDLTLHGVTKPVVLDARLTHLGAHPVGQFFDYYKGDWVAFSAKGQIDPADFGVGSSIPVGQLTINIDTELKAAK